MRLSARFTWVVLAGLLFPAISSAITIDATALSSPTFRVAAPVQGPFPTSAVQNVALAAGTYTFFDEANGAFSFDVDGAGLVSYDAALESFLDGAGTGTLTVRGYDITVNAQTLTCQQFAIPHVTGSTTATSWRPSSAVLAITVLPGDYGFMDFASNLIVFSVDGNGKVRFAPGQADYLQGAGTPNLVVRGFDFTVDARTLSSDTFAIAGITGITTATSFVSSALVLSVTGIPGASYDFRDIVSNDFLFSIDEDGAVQYAPSFEGFLNGAGSAALVVEGFTLTVDVRGIASTAPTFNLVGMINPGTSSVVQSWVGIPGSAYLFSTGIDLLFLSVDLAGHYQTLPATYGSFPVTGNGTNLLKIGITNSTPLVAITGPASGTVVAVGSTVVFNGSFSDDAGDTHTAQWTFDASSQAGVVDETAHTVTASRAFTTPGVYFVGLTVTDNGGASGTATTVDGLDAMVVVYDPNGGFVTGGGWIQSPTGAYPANPGMTGKANFGFESKYRNGASTPSGETEFQFKVASLNFHSTSYEWLVIAGARAQYKGSGTINGGGDYAFMLTATDGSLLGGNSPDKFRMRIWNKGNGQTIYDNMLGAADGDAPTTVLGGGSIVVHKSGSGPASLSPVGDISGGTAFALHRSVPNPTRGATQVSFDLPSRSHVRLDVYDLAGRQVASVASGWMDAGRHTRAWNGRDRSGAAIRPGLYFLRLEAREESGSARMAIEKLTIVE